LVNIARLRIHVVKIPKLFSAIPVILLSGLLAPQMHAAIIFTNLVSFEETNGASPEAALIQGKDGNLYGTTFSGGPGDFLNNGTVFQLTPSGAFTNLIAFDGTNGGPRAGLVQGIDGNFYGTTYAGGTNTAGTVFELTTNSALTTLVTFAFDDNNGTYPIAGLTQSHDGSFYGTTAFGGTNNYGTIFRLAPTGTFVSVLSFDYADGASPYAAPVQANDGDLYGTTYQGGANGFGTIYKLTTNGTFNSLYSFTGGSDGGNPYAGLVQGRDGNFYGTTFYGGSNGNNGTVFEFSSSGALTTLLSFDGTNGANPQGGLLQASDGNFYGTTFSGGDSGYGTIFRLATNGVLTTLISFDGTNGAAPEAGLMQSADGNFYGTTTHGGTNGFGTVFRLGVIVPPPKIQTVTRAGTTLTLNWSATVGQNYQMLYKTNLSQGAWSNLNNSVTATNPTMTTFDTTGPDRQRFYRILLLP